VAGQAPWQVLAGAATARSDPPQVSDSWFEVPYGVGYHVVTWRWQENA
jgi:hypothetical protein